MDGSFQIVKELENKRRWDILCDPEDQLLDRTEKSNPRIDSRLSVSACLSGGADRDRTGDPLLAKQVLSQLSYSPLLVSSPKRKSFAKQRRAKRTVGQWWVWEELNFRPHPYQGCALTN